MPLWLFDVFLSLSIVAFGLSLCGMLRTLNKMHARIVALEQSVNLLERFAATWATPHSSRNV